MCSSDVSAGGPQAYPRGGSAASTTGRDGRRIQLHVQSSESIASSLITAYLRSQWPDVEVRESNNLNNFSGVRVELTGSGRWMFVALSIDDVAELARAVAEGASAAVSLGARPEELRMAVQALMDGNRLFLSPSSARWMAEAALRQGGPRAEDRSEELNALTAREQEVLFLVSEGLSNEEIARSLTISANTVRTHLHSLALKLDTTSRASLIAKARSLFPTARTNEPVLFIERTA